MYFKRLSKLILVSIILLSPVRNAYAGQIQLDEAYFYKNLDGKCIFIFNKNINGYLKFKFNKKDQGTIFTQSGVVRDATVSYPSGNFRIEFEGRNGIMSATSAVIFENGKSYSYNLEKGLSDKREIYLGLCKTSFSKVKTLGSWPPTEGVQSAQLTKERSEPKSSTSNADEIAALEKKLAALKQKSARKEEYQKMRALLDQKLKEVQGQIQMLEQEYKDVLN